MQLTRMSKMYDIGDKVRIKKSGVIGTVVDANVSDDSWYIVEDDVKRDGKYELHDCIEEELEIVI
nr:MAG TPA: Preprotein translocase subunit [Bacteriophage sp.]